MCAVSSLAEIWPEGDTKSAVAAAPLRWAAAAETTAESGGDIGKAGSETAAESAAAAGGVATRRRSATGLPALHTSATVRNEEEKISPLQAQR